MATTAEYSVSFDNITDLINYSTGEFSACGVSHEAGRPFFGTRNWEDMMKLFSAGYRDGLREISSRVEVIEANAQRVTSQYEKQETGILFDVAEVLEGTPECWLNFTEEPVRDVVKMYVDIGMWSGITEDQKLNRGAAIISLVDQLSESGKIVELYATMSSEKMSSTDTLYTFIQCRINTQPLDMDQLGFLFSHLSSTRRLFWAVREQLTKDPGVALRVRPAMYPNDHVADGIFFPGLGYESLHKFSTLERAVEEVQKEYSLYMKGRSN